MRTHEVKRSRARTSPVYKQDGSVGFVYSSSTALRLIDSTKIEAKMNSTRIAFLMVFNQIFLILN